MFVAPQRQTSEHRTVFWFAVMCPFGAEGPETVVLYLTFSVDRLHC